MLYELRSSVPFDIHLSAHGCSLERSSFPLSHVVGESYDTLALETCKAPKQDDFSGSVKSLS
jgi:hypothetical protein